MNKSKKKLICILVFTALFFLISATGGSPRKTHVRDAGQTTKDVNDIDRNISPALFILLSDTEESTQLCNKSPVNKVDLFTPTVVDDENWNTPVRLGDPINTPCIEDAIEISADGQFLYYGFLTDVSAGMSFEELTASPHGTYKAARIGDPSEFTSPTFFDLGTGIDLSLDMELSFLGSTVYFHSLRMTNTGLVEGTHCVDDPENELYYDISDIYYAELDANGIPGAAVNLGRPVNSECWDGEHAIHPSGNYLFFASNRLTSPEDTDHDQNIWVSAKSGDDWDTPAPIDEVNSDSTDYQATITSDGSTMYFVSDRTGIPAIYKSTYDGSNWSSPVLVIEGAVGEPSITSNGEFLYFVHAKIDEESNHYDTDIWYVEHK